MPWPKGVTRSETAMPAAFQEMAFDVQALSCFLPGVHNSLSPLLWYCPTVPQSTCAFEFNH